MKEITFDQVTILARAAQKVITDTAPGVGVVVIIISDAKDRDSGMYIGGNLNVLDALHVVQSAPDNMIVEEKP